MIPTGVVGKPNFSGQFKKIIRRCRGLDMAWVSYGGLVVGLVTVCGCGFLFGCATVGRV